MCVCVCEYSWISSHSTEFVGFLVTLVCLGESDELRRVVENANKNKIDGDLHVHLHYHY